MKIPLLAFSFLFGLYSPLRAADQPAPFLQKIDLFNIADGKYKSYRIPCLLALPDNTVLTFVSARKAVSDWANTDIMMRRSTDAGVTWEEPRVIVDSQADTCDNPVAIWDGEEKAVHLLHQINYEKVFYLRSNDGGKTFTKPVDITPQLADLQKKYPWHVIATGPGHGIQLKNGRLIVPIWLSPGEMYENGKGRKHHPSVVSVIYSDDHGQTWHSGDIVPDTLKNLNETVAVETEDGGVMLVMRNEETAYAKAISFSKDGATNWSKPELKKELYSPICFASALRLPELDGKKPLLFANPDSHEITKVIRPWGGRPRDNLTFKLSYDDGKTWPVSKLLEAGRTGYSDLATLPDGTMLCFYERGEVPKHDINTQFLTLARFNMAWLLEKPIAGQ